MATRHSIERVNGYRLIPTEDYDLWLRMAAAGSRLQRLALPGLMYRHHPGQVTASPEWRRSSWENPEIAQAFAALSSQELGPAFTRITTLSIAEDLSAEERTARFDEFSGAFETALTGHSEAARRALSRKLTERRRWLHQRVTSAAPSQAARHRNQDNVPHKLPAGPDATGPRLAGPASTGSTPRERYLVAVAADRRANAAYPKSRLVLRWFRSAQRWRQTPGRLGRAMFMVIGGSYKVATEGLLGMELPVSTSVGPGLRLRHGFGIVVNPASRIGEGVMLRHGVTLGNRKTTDDCPVIEDGVEIGVGAVVIGAVTVGRGAKLGPNVVVARDVPAGACVLSPLSDTVLLRGKTTWASKGQAGSAA
jgi:serine acetyltransferase